MFKDNPYHRRAAEKQKFSNFKPKAPKPKSWSHQDDLTDLKGKRICVLTVHGGWSGELIEADQFTVKLAQLHDMPDLVIFKSAIITFRKD